MWICFVSLSEKDFDQLQDSGVAQFGIRAADVKKLCEVEENTAWMEENKKKIEDDAQAVAQPFGLCVESVEQGSLQRRVRKPMPPDTAISDRVLPRQ